MSQYNKRKHEIRAEELIKSRGYPGPRSAAKDDFSAAHYYAETEAEKNCRGPAVICVGFAVFLCLLGAVLGVLYLVH